LKTAVQLVADVFYTALVDAKKLPNPTANSAMNPNFSKYKNNGSSSEPHPRVDDFR